MHSNHPKTLTGIETIFWSIAVGESKSPTPITPKPLQGLKPHDIGGEWIVRVHTDSNHPKTLTGIETIPTQS